MGSVEPRFGKVEPTADRAGSVPLLRRGEIASPPVPESSIQLVGLSGFFKFFLSDCFATTSVSLRFESVLLLAPLQSAGLYRWDSQPHTLRQTQEISRESFFKVIRNFFGRNNKTCLRYRRSLNRLAN